jgi:succinyl-diaminopimelate desuccinylase
MKQPLFDILEKLISFKSVTPAGADAIEYISSLLIKNGFSCDVQTFGSEGEQVTNLYAVLGNGSPNICFAGHVDVVPPMNENLWRHNPFKMTVEGEKVFGRGTVDMKGAIACALAAVIDFLKNTKERKGAISFLLTTDEEGSGKHGTKEMLEYIKDKYPKIDLCILGEPTCEKYVGDTIKIGRRGSINFELKINGRQGHVAYPEKAVNPIPVMTNIISELINLKLDNGSKFFIPSNLEITSIDTGNDVTNIIPESISARFNIRFNDLHSSESLIKDISKIISGHSDDYDLQHAVSSESFVQELDDSMKRFISVAQKVTGIVPAIETGGGTSDARFIRNYTKVVELGLCSDQAHKIDEHTEIRDLQTLYNVYYSFLLDCLG